MSYRGLITAIIFAELLDEIASSSRYVGENSGIFSFLPKPMSTSYPLAATRGAGAPPAAALARLSCSARHQLWHLSSPLLKALRLLSGLAAAGPARAPQMSTMFPEATGSSQSVTPDAGSSTT